MPPRRNDPGREGARSLLIAGAADLARVMLGAVVALPRRAFPTARLRRALAVWLGDATGWAADGLTTSPNPVRILDADQGTPRPSLPYVSYQRTGGAAPATDEHNLGEALTGTTLQVSAAAVGESATALINSLRVSHRLAGPDTPTTARDALLAQLAASVEPVDGAPVGVDQLALAPQQPGELVRVQILEGLAPISEASEIVAHSQGSRVFRYRVQFHGLSDPLAAEHVDLDAFADAAITLLASRDMLRKFRGLGVYKSGPEPTPQRATVVSGARPELRVFFDVFLSVHADLAQRTDQYFVSAQAPTIATP